MRMSLLSLSIPSPDFGTARACLPLPAASRGPNDLSVFFPSDGCLHAASAARCGAFSPEHFATAPPPPSTLISGGAFKQMKVLLKHKVRAFLVFCRELSSGNAARFCVARRLSLHFWRRPEVVPRPLTGPPAAPQLVHHDGQKYDGYRLTTLGYDFLVRGPVGRALPVSQQLGLKRPQPPLSGGVPRRRSRPSRIAARSRASGGRSASAKSQTSLRRAGRRSCLRRWSNAALGVGSPCERCAACR